MEDQKKKNPPQKEGGYKESGQRISVRPGNFAPPAERAARNEAHGEARSERPEKQGETAGEERSRRNERQNGSYNRSNHHGRDNRGRERRDQGSGENGGNSNRQQNRPADNRRAASSEERGGKQQQSNGGKGRNNNRRPHGTERRDNAAPRENTTPLNETLKRELDAEFESVPFASFSSLQKTEHAAVESAVDTEEFAVDIATAAYLVEDIPCGFPAPDAKSVEVIGVRFRHAGKIFFFAPGKEKFRIGEAVIVDTARGPELGEVVMLNRRIAEKDVPQPLRSVLRRATAEDTAHYEDNRKREAEALKICAEKVAHHKLDMHLVEAQYTFDNTKLLFYFTSEGRVDFRELVRDLAGIFRTRIELRQIGIRDESRLIGGLGMCGRPFCCTTFLSDFGQVSVKMAKEQGLSINTSKISGCCGRLMCCLRYEHETYAAEAALTPQKDTRVETADGVGTVIECTPLAGTVKVRLDKAPEEAPTVYHRDKVTVIGKAAEQKAEEDTPDSEEPQD